MAKHRCTRLASPIFPVVARLTLFFLVVLALAGLSVIVQTSSVFAQDDATFSEMQASATFGTALTFQTRIRSATPIENVELYWHADGDLELSAAYPEFSVGNDIVVSHDVDLSFIYIPPGIDIVYFWRVIDSNGNVTDSVEQLLFYMDDGPSWDSITNGLVTVWWYSGNQEFAEDILETANRTIESLSRRFDVTADEAIRIVIYGNDSDFMNALPPNSADWIGGQAHPSLNLIVAQVRPGTGAGREVRRMIPHEVSHLIVHQATENPWNSPPNWLDEGLAVYNQETPDADLPDILDDAVDSGDLIPVRALGSNFPVDPDQAYLSYAQSHSIVTYIIEELGEDEMAELIAVFRDEVSYDEAVERSLDMSIEELDAAWKEWLGYAGDSTPVDRSPESDSQTRPQMSGDDDDLTRNELIGVLTCTGLFALAGLGLGIASVAKLRAIGRSQ